MRHQGPGAPSAQHRSSRAEIASRVAKRNSVFESSPRVEHRVPLPSPAFRLAAASRSFLPQVDFGVGKGFDADAKSLVWVMDTAKFPSYRAENYHQFHDGFAFGENYPDSYNSIGSQQLKLEDTSCPSF